MTPPPTAPVAPISRHVSVYELRRDPKSYLGRLYDSRFPLELDGVMSSAHYTDFVTGLNEMLDKQNKEAEKHDWTLLLLTCGILCIVPAFFLPWAHLARKEWVQAKDQARGDYMSKANLHLTRHCGHDGRKRQWQWDCFSQPQKNVEGNDVMHRLFCKWQTGCICTVPSDASVVMA
eukprot:TRINITY_DN48459_c0_g1_i1.p1 TRINITY_DN48459_c0_g1~~TRINITY_DN48459_c0_g1_i1.p1  ORF type:complete len:176 (-),score=17.86 TRINITY_DN48459_c0_g1_i1:150-677(-)